VAGGLGLSQLNRPKWVQGLKPPYFNSLYGPAKARALIRTSARPTAFSLFRVYAGQACLTSQRSAICQAACEIQQKEGLEQLVTGWSNWALAFYLNKLFSTGGRQEVCNPLLIAIGIGIGFGIG